MNITLTIVRRRFSVSREWLSPESTPGFRDNSTLGVSAMVIPLPTYEWSVVSEFGKEVGETSTRPVHMCSAEKQNHHAKGFALIPSHKANKKSSHYRKQPLQDQRPLSEQNRIIHILQSTFGWIVRWGSGLQKQFQLLYLKVFKYQDLFFITLKLGCALSFCVAKHILNQERQNPKVSL